MTIAHQTKIRDRAYALWERDGSPEGKHLEYWHRAERQLAEEAGVDISDGRRGQAADGYDTAENKPHRPTRSV